MPGTISPAPVQGNLDQVANIETSSPNSRIRWGVLEIVAVRPWKLRPLDLSGFMRCIPSPYQHAGVNTMTAEKLDASGQADLGLSRVSST
jgi:hypothetical protein